MKNHNDLNASNFEEYLKAARKSLQDKNWISALDIALTLPGICSNIDPETKKRVGIKQGTKHGTKNMLMGLLVESSELPVFFLK